MARGGINKALVQQAREAVLAKCQRQLNLDPWEVRTFSWTDYAVIPKRCLCSMGLMPPSESLMRCSLYQRM